MRSTALLLLLMACPLAAGPLSIQVTVRAEDGTLHPVHGARVAVVPAHTVVFAEPILAGSRMRTDEQGRVLLPERPDPGRELLVLAGLALRAIEGRRVPPGSSEVVIELPPEANLAVVVRDAAGKPVRGAEILVAPEDPMEGGSFLVPGSILFREFTDGEGRVLVYRLSPRSLYRVKVTATGRPATLLRRVEPGQETVEVRLAAGAAIHGRVVAVPGGRPVVGARVSVGRTVTTTDREGKFRFERLEPGLHRIEARVAGRQRAEGIPIVLREGETREGVVIRVRSLGRLTGRVLGPTTRPVPDVRLFLRYPPGPITDPLLPPRRVVAAGSTDAEGRFDLRDLLPAQGVDLIALHPEHAPAVYLGYPILPDRTFDTLVLLKQGGAISGTVSTGPGRQPVGGAEVIALNHRELPSRFFSPDAALPVTSRVTVTAEDGAFELSHLPPGTILLLVRHERHLPRVVRDLEVANRERLTGIEIALGEGACAVGRVLGPSGDPVPGARVSLAPATGPLRTTRCDEAGRFRLDALPSGSYRLRVEADGFARHEREPLILPGEEIEVRLSASTGVGGRVIRDDSGEPIPVAVVRALAAGPPDPLAPGEPTYDEACRVETEPPGGTFRMDDLAPGTYRFEAWTPAGLWGSRSGLEVGPASTTPLVIRVGGGWPITGAVVDGRTGDPVEGARVRILGPGDAPESFCAVTGDLGIFRLDSVPPGHHRLRIAATGYCLRLLESVEVRRGGVTRLPDIALSTGARLRGRVLDASGQPVKGARLRLRSAALRTRFSGPTDGWGEFEFSLLAPGPWLLTSEDSAAGTGPCLDERLINLVEGDDLILTLGGEGGSSLSGRITRGADPVAYARIEALWASRESFETRRLLTATTDEAGRYAFRDLPAGEIALLVKTPEDPTTATRFTVHLPPGPGTVRDLALPVSGIGGTVEDLDDDSPLPGVALHVYRLTPASGASLLDRLTRRVGEVRSAVDGTFQIPGLPPGRYRISTSLPGYGHSTVGPIRVFAGGTADVRIVLRRAPSVSGRVRDRHGRPVGGARISFFDDEGRPASPKPHILADVEGRFAADFLPPGRFLVVARAPGYGRARLDDLEIPASGRSDLELELTDEGRLEVIVFGPGGVRIPRATISLTDFWGRETRFLRPRTSFLDPAGDPDVTDAEGRLVVRNLAPGLYEVRATHPRFAGKAARVRVLGGEQARAAVILE